MPNFQPSQKEFKKKFQDFLKKNVGEDVQQLFDLQQFIPRDFLKKLGLAGFLGASVPKKWGGLEMNYIELGLMHESLGQVLASLENIITVFGMVCKALVKFGNEEQKNFWLPKIVLGDAVVALALTEPGIGSDLKNIETQAKLENKYYVLNGKKKYITLGEIADLFLVFANSDGKFVTLLVEKNTPGLKVTPIRDLMGLRSNMLAELSFSDCCIPLKNLLGQHGSGLAHVVSSVLDEGRYTTACGCLGLGQSCLDLGNAYAETRIQSGVFLKDHQLIQKILAKSIAYVKAARELCFHAGYLRDQNDDSYVSETLVAKYFSSEMAVSVSGDILQIFGAAGFTKAYSIERFYRDAKVMSVIEGTTQIYETLIPKVCIK